MRFHFFTLPAHMRIFCVHPSRGRSSQ